MASLVAERRRIGRYIASSISAPSTAASSPTSRASQRGPPSMVATTIAA